VHLLGGEISVQSQLGLGSTFKFDIIIRDTAGEDVAEVVEERSVVGLSPQDPHCRVLVADDAPGNRELLVELLEPVGFEVRSVADGKEALREFEEWHPQLVLMDMRMPVMDGYEATRRIRRASGGSDVVIIGVTASAFAEMRQDVFDAGVDEFIAKPFRASELFGKMGQLLPVHYICEEKPEKIQGVAALSYAPLAELPTDLISRLRRAAIAADFDTVLELADEAEGHDERAAATLRALAERFDSEQILRALPGADES